MSEAGMSLDAMAARLGRTRQAVQQQRLAIGCKPMKLRRLTPEHLAGIRRCFALGMSLRETGVELGLSNNAVCRNAKKIGVSNGRKRGRATPNSDWGWTGEHPKRKVG